MPLFRRRRKFRTPIAGRPGMQGRAAARQRPGPTKEMQSKAAAALGPRKLVRLSNFQQAATMQRRSWGGTLLIGPLIEWILNFVYRGRRFRTGVQRRPLKGMVASVGAKSKGKRIRAKLERQRARELAQMRDAA